MLTIRFYPESDNRDLEVAAKEYTNIWNNEGDRITKTLEKYSRFSFDEKMINAVVFEGMSRSHPLLLRASYSLQTKKCALVHELCHRISRRGRLKFDKPEGDFTLEVHKIIFLILYDALVELYGKKVADQNVSEEKSHDLKAYDLAWEWALGMSPEERREKYNSLKV